MSPDPFVLAELEQKRWPRLDTAKIFKRFHHLERALLIAAAGWIPAMSRLETKAALARIVWQNSLTADALRERVFELRYPSRALNEGEDAPIIAVYRTAKHAPSRAAFLRALADLFAALQTAYEQYLDAADQTADGPSFRFLELALREKEEQARALAALITQESTAASQAPEAEGRWLSELRTTLERLGSVPLAPPLSNDEFPEVLPWGKRFQLAQEPARDERYFACSFYWPDILDPSFPYGRDAALQLRAAVSHLNEVWAVDTAGAIIEGLSGELDWEFVRDGARWLFDESRHMLMGKERLERWGFHRSDIPLGDYIYTACRGQDPIYRIGMLGYFETKNIGKKRDRAETFAEMGDQISERHMEFDWADETIHAGYGRRWLKCLLEQRGGSGDDYPHILKRCEALVAERVARATDDEAHAIRECAQKLMAEAERRVLRQAVEGRERTIGE